LRWIAAVAGLVLVVLIGVVAGFPAAEAAVGVIVLLYGLTLLVMGTAAARFVPKWCRSGSSGAIRVLGVGFVLLAPYFLIFAVEFQSHTLVSPDVFLVGYVAFFGCVTLAAFLAWRAVRRNPLRPEHGKRQYFWGGTVPVSRLSAAAAILGIVSLLVTALVAYSFNGLPSVTLALAAAAVVLGAAAFVRAWMRRPSSRLVPAGAIVAGLLAGAMTTAIASTADEILGMACAAPSHCVAVGLDGSVATVDDGVHEAVETIAGAGTVNGVACMSSKTCVAVGYASDGSSEIVVTLARRRAAPWTATSIQHVTRILNGVACPSTSRCVAVGGGVVVITNGTPGSLQQLPAGVTLNGVACATPDACEAVGTIDAADGNGPAVWAPITNGVIGAIHRVSGSDVLEAIACPTLTICLAVGEANGYGGLVEITNESAGAVQQFADIYDASSISCPTADLCAVAGYATGGVGPAQALVALHQGRIGASRILEGGTTYPEVVCTAADTCLVAGTPSADSVTSVSIP
jgi:HAMP domain-containing protein